MTASLHALLSGVVDYAGLFPPAKLPLDEAIRNYARYRHDADAWMLGRFVIPAARLAEMQTWTPASFSVLVQAGDSAVGSIEAPGWVDSVEMRGPFDRETATGGAAAFQGAAASFFYEIVFVADWQTRLFEIAETLAAFAADRPKYATGFKLRTGGLKASDFPSIEQVAFVLHTCRETGVPLKFTAGLHHPLRHFDADLQTHMHGFINVFTAGVLAHARHLQEDALRAVIADEDAADFVFTDDGLRWRDVFASTAEIAVARRDYVTSFGSCSFDEPRDDLRALGWL